MVSSNKSINVLYVLHINTVITVRFQHTFFLHNLLRFAVFINTLFSSAVLKLYSEATLKFTYFFKLKK